MSDSRPHPPIAGQGAVSLHEPQDRGKIPREFGRYRIQDCLGRGGMGAVFRAHDTQLDRTVALKVPFLGKEDDGTRERFYREARSAAALHHANICPVFDVGEQDGFPYLTMAFIEGRSLATALENGRTFTPQQAALLVRKLALAMQEAHTRGVVHRDLKPGNVLLRPDGEPIITDFGLARRDNDRQSEGLTREGDVIGTIEYMSPEQFEGDNASVGPPSDVYALGVILYELLTGRRPFAGGTASKMAAILIQPTPRPSHQRPGLPAKLDEISVKAMAKDPAERFTMGQFAEALTAFLRTPQSGVTATAAARPAVAPPTPPISANTKPIQEKAPTPKPAVAVEAGWEVVEAPPPAPPKPRSVVKAKVLKPRKKAATGTNRPIIFGAGALGAACLTLIIVAVIVRSGGPDTPPTTPVTAPSAPIVPVQPTPPSAKAGGPKAVTSPTAPKGTTPKKKSPRSTGK